MRKVRILSENKFGYFHQFESHDCVIIELEDGTMSRYDYTNIQFINNPENEHLEDEQRAEFANTANAILQGLAQRNGWYWQGSGIDENLTGFLPSDCKDVL